MKDFSDKLKKRLKEIGMTQGVLCEKIDVTPTGLINSIKNNNLKVETLEKICEIINVEPDYFLDVKPKQSGAIMMMVDDLKKELDKYKMLYFEAVNEKMTGNFQKLSKYSPARRFSYLRKRRKLRQSC